MRPALGPGDGLVAVRGGAPRKGQLRLFRDPRLSTRWLVKRVADVHGAGGNAIFEARSDNPQSARRGRLPRVRLGARCRLLPRGVDGPGAPKPRGVSLRVSLRTGQNLRILI